VKQAAFYVLRGTYSPGILVEMGFMTNSSDQKNMNDKKTRAKIANSIYKAVLKYAEMKQWK
ncbi:MAG: N-acetylmuramoyl-L-alanine amidase, partial [Elusimicrobiota bacterium]|nr:N-acetylmuramoyl-L-alanine amidase [Elusimicrobiota bacterium]